MKRVVVTGYGAVTPLGENAKLFLEAIYDEKIGIKKIEKFDTSEFKVKVAGEISGFDPTKRIPIQKARKMDLFSQYAVYSALEAAEMAKINFEKIDPEDIGVIYGSGIGGLTTIQEQIIKLSKKGNRRVSPMFVPNSILNMASANISIFLNAQNVSQTVTTACASGTDAIGQAFNHIRDGHAKIMFTGGSEATINEIGISGFASLHALSEEPNEQLASRPFDADRSGFVMGEGAGTLVLEELEHAKSRGAEIFGEIVGYGYSADAYHLTMPSPNGRGAKKAMLNALKDAKIEASDINYINAHGTGTKANDTEEARAIYDIFGSQKWVSSTKGMTGHLLGAAGAIECIISLDALKRQYLPANVGIREKDKDVLINIARPGSFTLYPFEYAMSNSFGFGGHNGVLVMKRWL